jgi:hypothetical protein
MLLIAKVDHYSLPRQKDTRSPSQCTTATRQFPIAGRREGVFSGLKSVIIHQFD